MMGNSFINLKFPQYSSDGSILEFFDTNESYLQYYRDKKIDSESSHVKRQEQELEDLSKINPEKLTEKRLAEKEVRLKKIHHQAEKEIVHQLPLFFIALLIFIIHCVLYRRQRRFDSPEKGKSK